MTSLNECVYSPFQPDGMTREYASSNEGYAMVQSYPLEVTVNAKVQNRAKQARLVSFMKGPMGCDVCDIDLRNNTVRIHSLGGIDIAAILKFIKKTIDNNASIHSPETERKIEPERITMQRRPGKAHVLVQGSQTFQNDAGGSVQGISFELQSKDLPSKRLLGKGLASIGYETELNGMRFARKDFVGVPIGIFKSEAAKFVSLKDHPNIVKTHGLTIDKMSCSLVLEYMDEDFLAVLQKRKRYKASLARTNSGNQSELCLSQPFELPEALGFMLQIARGMEYLHEQGILHGDLKTKNILVAHVKDGDKNLLSLKVADFGLVRTKRKSMSYVSRQGRKLDMVRWKAPENLEVLLLDDKNETSSESGSDSDEKCAGSSSVTDLLHCADVYSFAVTCFQILTGEDPYPNLNWKELVTKIVAGELRPNLPIACPPLLRNLLETCWSKVPAQRPTFTHIRRKLQYLHIRETVVGPS